MRPQQTQCSAVKVQVRPQHGVVSLLGAAQPCKMWSEAEPLSAGLGQAAASSRGCAATLGGERVSIQPRRLLCLQAQGVQQ